MKNSPVKSPKKLKQEPFVPNNQLLKAHFSRTGVLPNLASKKENLTP
jgi:hypothetical protein